jgi:hypothetical protein
MLPLQPAAPIESITTVDSSLEDTLVFVYEDNWREHRQVDPSRHPSASSPRTGGNVTMGLLYNLVFDILNSPRRLHIYVRWNMCPVICRMHKGWNDLEPRLHTEMNLESRRQFWQGRYCHPLTPHNTITIFISDRKCGPSCVERRGLRRLLTLPAG